MSENEDAQFMQNIAQTIAFGAEVEAFLNSSIGKYLVERAEGQRESAIEEFKRINPALTSEVVEIHHKLMVAEAIQHWLADAILAGHEAARQLEEMQYN